MSIGRVLGTKTLKSGRGRYLDLEGGELRRSISWRQRLLKGTSVPPQGFVSSTIYPIPAIVPYSPVYKAPSYQPTPGLTLGNITIALLSPMLRSLASPRSSSHPLISLLFACSPAVCVASPRCRPHLDVRPANSPSNPHLQSRNHLSRPDWKPTRHQPTTSLGGPRHCYSSRELLFRAAPCR